MPVPSSTAGVAGLLECLWLKDKFFWGGEKKERKKKSFSRFEIWYKIKSQS